ncbi:uncharacterized protein Cen isoform X2 [Bemisia tabaci]|uniref:uncharacterized protein Cen isoform X2 n=1 Tax=Bemisia tabaci TaxID=7038 RepID=UPI003B27DAB8
MAYVNKEEEPVSLLSVQSMDYWDYSLELECLRGPEDLQLAAELGKTLLERNKELENSLRQHQCIIEDRTQEIEYLTKQTAALREVNESRLRIYEQLEISIQDLERTNHRLVIDSASDKKQIKSLLANIEALELRCEELQRALDEITVEVEREKIKSKRLSACSPIETELPPIDATSEELNDLLKDNQMLKTKNAKCERKIVELQQKISCLLEENEALNEDSNKLLQRDEYIRCLQEEVSTLEQIRQGKLCQLCLQNTDNKFRLTAEDDDESIADSLLLDEKQDAFLKIQNEVVESSEKQNEHYRDLVEKYNAVIEAQRPPPHLGLSLQEELQLSGDFNSFNKVQDDSDSETDKPQRKEPRKKEFDITSKAAFSSTPTDFSEAETSSSGFSDETSNKGTQTDTHFPPGSLLCAIFDGDRYSLYDDTSPLEKRFRRIPKYKQLFQEIFEVLSRASAAKDEGEKLPLMHDATPVCENLPKVPPVTPAQEELPLHLITAASDNVSVISEELSETSGSPRDETKTLTKTAAKKLKKQAKQAAKQDLAKAAEAVLSEQDFSKKTPEEQSEHGSKKKSHGRKKSREIGGSSQPSSPFPTAPSSPALVPKGSPAKVTRRRRFEKGVTDSPVRSAERSSWCVPNDRDLSRRISQEGSNDSPKHSLYKRKQMSVHDFLPYSSSAAQEVAKLKILEKSYADVLKLGMQKAAASRTNSYQRK